MSPKVLFIGLGNMGWGMAKNIAEKGQLDQPLMVYNRTQERAEAFRQTLPEGKVVVVGSLKEAAGEADVIFTMLSNDKAAEAVYAEILAENSAAPSSVAGKLFVESSTVHPDTTGKLAKTVEARGASFVAAPVFGAPAMAEAGQLVGVLAGSGAAIDRALPFFRGVMSRADIAMRDEPVGRAPLLKLVGNTFVMNMVEQLAEGHVLAEKTGLPNEYVHEFVAHLFAGPYAAYSQRMLSGQYYTREQPLFGVDLARKDLGHALNIAAAAGVRLPNTETADAHLAAVKQYAGEKGDLAGIYGAVRKEAGLPYENQ